MSLEYKVLGQSEAAELALKNVYTISQFGGGYAISTDPELLSWSLYSEIFANYSNPVVGNGIFFSNNYTQTSSPVTSGISTDGITWTLSTSPFGGQPSYSNGLFIVIGTSGATSYAGASTDGITWTTSVPPISNSVNNAKELGIPFGAGKYITLQYLNFDTFGNENRGMVSTDGINWTLFTMPVYAAWSQVIYADNKFVAINFAEGGDGEGEGEGGNGYAYISTDGVTWTPSITPLSGSNIAYGNGVFVAKLTFAGPYKYSTDAITWQDSLFNGIPESAADYLVFDGEKFVTGGRYTNSIATSTDGVTWTILSDALPFSGSDGGYRMEIGQLDFPSATTIYTVPESKQTIVSSAFIANNSESSQTYSVAVVPDGETLSSTHYIRKDVTIDANDFNTIETKITLSEGDQIITESSSEDVVINIFGVEK